MSSVKGLEKERSDFGISQKRDYSWVFNAGDPSWSLFILETERTEQRQQNSLKGSVGKRQLHSPSASRKRGGGIQKGENPESKKALSYVKLGFSL